MCRAIDERSTSIGMSKISNSTHGLFSCVGRKAKGDYIMKSKEILISQLEAIVSLHQKMSKSYFFTPPMVARNRRSYEEKNSLDTVFEYEGDVYRIEQVTKCSCKHVYYSVDYYKNYELIHADIRLVKKILKKLQASVTDETVTAERN